MNQHGTSEQCHRIVNVIIDSLENKLYCSAAFLDVKQDFGRVWHNGLLFKLKTLLPTAFYLLLKSDLHEMHFYVSINDEDSECGTVGSGVPQGSVSEPILYTIFTSGMSCNNDVCNYCYLRRR